jgi:hypothetical protein
LLVLAHAIPSRIAFDVFASSSVPVVVAVIAVVATPGDDPRRSEENDSHEDGPLHLYAPAWRMASRSADPWQKATKKNGWR